MKNNKVKNISVGEGFFGKVNDDGKQIRSKLGQ